MVYSIQIYLLQHGDQSYYLSLKKKLFLNEDLNLFIVVNFGYNIYYNFFFLQRKNIIMRTLLIILFINSLEKLIFLKKNNST